MTNTTPTTPTKRFSLSIGPMVDLLIEARDSGRRWNGFAVPILTEDQAAIIGAAIGEADLQAGESDGLQWQIEPEPLVCIECGMPHTAEHSCEAIQPSGKPQP